MSLNLATTTKVEIILIEIIVIEIILIEIIEIILIEIIVIKNVKKISNVISIAPYLTDKGEHTALHN